MIEDLEISQEKDSNEEQLLHDGAMDSSEEGFVKGFSEEEEVEECLECGGAVNPEKKVVRKIEGDSHIFCSKDCAEEFEESLS